MSNLSEKQYQTPVQIQLKPGLYIVATPIGNLRDITLRALDVLSSCDLVACEDTRVSGKLLKAYSLEKKMVSYNDHSDDFRRDHILNQISEGASVVLISDAGSPLISDPGYKLVRACADLGLNVTSIPGASASIMAMQLSALPSDQFAFAGFIPNKQKARQDFLSKWQDFQASWIAYETAPRLLNCLQDMMDVLGDRKLCVARELTKMYEEVRFDTISNHVRYYSENGAPKGELVLVIQGATRKVYSEEQLIEELRDALKSMKTKQAVAFVAEKTGESKRDLYQMALDMNSNGFK